MSLERLSAHSRREPYRLSTMNDAGPPVTVKRHAEAYNAEHPTDNTIHENERDQLSRGRRGVACEDEG